MKKHIAWLASSLFLLSSAACTRAADAPWVDKSPHRQAFLAVNGIKVECLDWGGNGEPIVLLGGVGATGHIYDNFAPQFTNNFRVIALTRRGLGASDKPKSGYDLATLTEDIRQSLDALNIHRAILVGHSFGCQEAGTFATAFPERVSKVVYLDGAFKLSAEAIDLEGRIVAILPQPSPQECVTFAALLKWLQKNQFGGWNDACEAQLRQTTVITAAGNSTGTTPDFVVPALLEGARLAPPDFAKVRAPALALFTDGQIDKLKAMADQSATPEVKEALKEMMDYKHHEIERFKNTVKNATIIQMTNTAHACFIQRQEEVAHHVRLFLQSNPPNHPVHR